MSYYRNDYRDNYSGYGGNSEVVSVAAWVGILILLAIPIVNIIALLIMAFSNGNKNIQNYAKASLLLILIGVMIILFFGACASM